VTDDKTAGFLAVEKIARNLASSLARLDEEANRYSGAATKLNEVAEATRELARAMNDVGEHATETLRVISSIGGPEIIERITALQTMLTANSETHLAKLNDQAEATRGLARATNAVGEQTAKVLQVVSSIGWPEIVERLASLEAKSHEDSSAHLAKLNGMAALTRAALLLSFFTVALIAAKFYLF